MEASPLQFLPEAPAWTRADGAESAVILTTRVRLARNLVGEVFPGRMTKDDRQRVVEAAAEAISTLKEHDQGAYFSLTELSAAEIGVLVERRAISPQLAQGDLPRAVFLWKEADRAIMVCEEDHIRVTEIVPGLAPQEAYASILPILDQLGQRFSFEHNEELGYLTACPANLGEAVRTSLFCHLPGLVMTDGLEDLASHASDAGFTVRGFWGEGSEVQGNTFQFTDGPGLSHPTSDMLSRIESLGREVAEREALARIDLQTHKEVILKDKIARALSILQSCRILSGTETLALFSAMRLGIDLGYVEGVRRKDISLLICELGKRHLKWTLPEGRVPEVRQAYRADQVRAVFSRARFLG